MPVQLPPQFNYLNKPGIDQARQQTEWNALRNERFSQEQRIENSKWLAASSKMLLEAGPEVARQNFAAWENEGKNRGIWESLPAEATQMDDEQFMSGLVKAHNGAMTGLAGQPQPERYEDVMQDGVLVGQRDERNKYTSVKSALSSMFDNPAQLRMFEAMTEDMSDEDRLAARRIELGLDARAGTTSSRERIATDPGLTADVAESESTIREAGKFAEMQGSQRSQTIDKGFSTIQKIDQNIRNLDKAVTALDAGANTGYIESNFFPSVKTSTIELEQIQKLLGLDVIGSVTFGALSKGELDLALETALPTGLEEDKLKEWLIAKKESQTKLRKYYSDQIDFLDQGGSVAGFLRAQGRGGTQQTTAEPNANAPAGRFTIEEIP